MNCPSQLKIVPTNTKRNRLNFFKLHVVFLQRELRNAAQARNLNNYWNLEKRRKVT